MRAPRLLGWSCCSAVTCLSTPAIVLAEQLSARLSGDDEPVDFFEEPTETEYAQRRLTSRTYVYRTFSYPFAVSSDYGQPSRYAYKVFDEDSNSSVRLQGEEYIVQESTGGRVQLKVLICREAGKIKDLWIQKVPTSGDQEKIKDILHLHNENAETLVAFLRQLEQVPLLGNDSIRIGDEVLNTLLANPDSLSTLYERDPEAFREMIANDNSARDVVALARRRGQVEKFRALLSDDGYFDSEVAKIPGGKAESVWQSFFEENAWILGATLSTQLLTSWEPGKLEQVVTGRSIGQVGKRVDALLRTAGAIRSLVFAEFKTHRTPLLGKEYRSGCWSPSEHLTGGVAQSQGTVHRAVTDIGERLGDTGPDGSEVPGGYSYLLRPRSYLVVGRLSQLVGDQGGANHDWVRSFELYRRSLQEPDIITYDELLARAEWFLSAAAEADH